MADEDHKQILAYLRHIEKWKGAGLETTLGLIRNSPST